MQFAQTVIPTEAGTDFITALFNSVKDNLVSVLGILAFIIALSVVMALFDTAKEGRMLSKRAKNLGL